MIYKTTMIGTFLRRPNRFLAHVLVSGVEVVCHVKNTGRLRELLIPGAPVVVQFHPDASELGRKTEYSLISVAKPIHAVSDRCGNFVTTTPLVEYTWVNIDSQAPNQAAYEWMTEGNGLQLCPRPQNVRREVRYGKSRFDLAFDYLEKPWLMEVKGVTLDVNGTAMFPDAPTERGVKHLEELAEAVENGFCAAVLFVIQMKGISTFTPHAERHPAFAEALANVQKRGVHILAYDCIVTEDSLQIDAPVPVCL